MPPDPPDSTAATDRFAWHPEPDLLGFSDPAARPALERLGADAWSAALDYLYDHAFARAMGEPAAYAPLRETFFGASGERDEAPLDPTTSAAILAEFRERLAPHQLNAYHPRSLSYFTPPPLLMSVIGELLAQVTQQGVDVWHAGPTATFVEEEVIGWLCDLVGYGPGSFGLLTSGGVMANFLAIALARDTHLPRLRNLHGPARGARSRRRPGVHLRPDPLLDRPGARRARLPCRHARRPAGRRPIPPPGGARCGGDRARPGRAG